jgi:ribosomal protein L16/L10AE
MRLRSRWEQQGRQGITKKEQLGNKLRSRRNCKKIEINGRAWLSDDTLKRVNILARRKIRRGGGRCVRLNEEYLKFEAFTVTACSGMESSWLISVVSMDLQPIVS